MTTTGQFIVSLLRSLNFRVALLCILRDCAIIATLGYIYMYIGAGGSVAQTGHPLMFCMDLMNMCICQVLLKVTHTVNMVHF